MDKPLLDPQNPKHAHAEERLNADELIWLGSVRPDGRPHLVPVWFLWQGGELYILTQPGSQKVRNLKANPNVILALQAAPDGGDVIILEGIAAFLEPGDFAPLRRVYVEKYGEAIVALGMDMDQMTASYSLLVRVIPKRINVW